MSEGALFLHVVRSDSNEDVAVASLLEWVEMVQQEQPGAVMGVVWTRVDCVKGGIDRLQDSPTDWQWDRMCVTSIAAGTGGEETWVEMWYLKQRGPWRKLEGVEIVWQATNTNTSPEKRTDARLTSATTTPVEGSPALDAHNRK